MRKANASRLATVLFVAILGLPLSAGLVHAVPVTMNFSGGVDFTSIGGPAVNTFSGFVTWDSDALPFESGPGVDSYDVLSYQLIFNGVDVTRPILGGGTGNGVAVFNDSDVLEPGNPQDVLAFFAAFRPSFEPLGVPGNLALVTGLIGPTTMFDSTALPASLDFLELLTTSESFWLFEPDGPGEDREFLLDVRGTLVAAVPVPPMWSLIALGLGALARARRAHRKRGGSRR